MQTLALEKQRLEAQNRVLQHTVKLSSRHIQDTAAEKAGHIPLLALAHNNRTQNRWSAQMQALAKCISSGLTFVVVAQEAHAKQQERILLETSSVYWRGLTDAPVDLDRVKSVTMGEWILIFEVCLVPCSPALPYEYDLCWPLLLLF